MNGVRTDLLDKAMAMVETLCGDERCQQTWGTVDAKKTIHACDFCSSCFDLSLLRGSVRETGESMLCVQLIESIDWVE